ncbi:hypothetical protein ACVBR5_000888 [Burkholderia cenocepacia]
MYPNDNKVFNLHERRGKGDQRLVEALEEMILRVRTGEIYGMVAAFVDPEGICTYMLSGAAMDSPVVAATVAGRLKARVDRYVMD